MKRLFLVLAALLPLTLAAQQPVILHSHNDYNRTAPFWEAYSQHCQSIEADVFLHNGELLVGHEVEDLKPENSFLRLYVDPIVRTFRANGGKMWAGSQDRLMLLVELKSATEPTLTEVIEQLEEFPDVFCCPEGVKVAITGNTPSKDHFRDYPEWVGFDGDIRETYTWAQLERVALVSNSFRMFAKKWNGKGRMIDPELNAVKDAIAKVHSWGKPIRFWEAPEGTTAYFTFWKLGVDIINTDKPAVAHLFFDDWGNKNFIMGKHEVQAGVTGTKKLDAATRSFSGFQNEKLQLSGRIPVYKPTYKNDGADKKIKNVILLIGDGMGINQVMAGAYANGRELSMLNIKSVGIQYYNPNDDFIGDSASGGSALATGDVSWTRHIATNKDGSVEYSPLTDYFKGMGKATGVVSLGDIADATPAVFYGHTSERDSTDKITSYWLTSDVDLICGPGTSYLEKPRQDGLDMLNGIKANGYTYTKDATALGSEKGKVLCLDDRMGAYATEETLSFLADITKASIEKLSQDSKKGFFLMVEGAKIDYAGHSDCFPASVIEQLGFDLAVAEALKFADSNGETLVVVTADHETGGLTLLDGDLQTGHVLAVYNSDDHTPTVVPVFAYGPGSREFIGTNLNVEIPRTIKKLVTK
ncbi:MAG: alkaline phosphatase [Bacteroidales bacterium]|nr:alkaline phosphatase [Bacteroidales bacterium]